MKNLLCSMRGLHRAFISLYPSVVPWQHGKQRHNIKEEITGEIALLSHP